MTNAIIEFIKYIGMGFVSGIDILLKLIPVYNELSGLKEEIIALIIGVPAFVISIIVFVIKVIRKESKK